MSLYLKYRPQNFESLVGQEFIKKTLQTALMEDKMVSSYLLCGPRGTGKTTTARILAAGVNCLDIKLGNPCGECDNCRALVEGSLIDIIEIDAASYTGVDNIREIIERAQFQPTQAKFKVYIVDEVHMLSKGAFNALLKILEEPPKHVKFILATTETHKVPDTIISRCQRYDFKSISNIDIQNRLQSIAESEGISIDAQSLDYISRAASGGMRNAINLFEQLIEGNKIEYSRLTEKLGLTDEEKLSDIYIKLLKSDISVLQDIDHISQEGKNMQLFYSHLLQYAKNQTLENLNTPDIQTRIHILKHLNTGLSEMKYSFDPEVTILSMLSQILGIYKQYVPKIIEKEIELPKLDSTSSTNNKKNLKQEKIDYTNTVEVPEQDILSRNDVDEIFFEDIKKESKTVKNKEKSEFDIDAYIETLRSLQVKGALIISLKQARSFTLFDEYLEIVLQNNFTLKALNTGDNVLQLIKGLEKMGIEGKTVKLS